MWKDNRMDRIRKWLPLLCIIVLIFTGCEVNGTPVYFTSGCGRNTVFIMGKESCDIEEANIYLYNYKNLYGEAGGESIWNDSYDTAHMTEIIKESVLESLTMSYALSIYAEENEIELSEDEQEKIKGAAEEYFDSLTDEEKKFFGVKEKDIEKMYSRYALSYKVYLDLMNSVDEEVSEDEARVMDAYVFYVTGEERANEAMNALETTPFENVAMSFNEGIGSISVSFPRNTYPPEVEDAFFRLDNDEEAVMLPDSEGHYYFAKCISKYNAELSEENKSNVIGSRQQAMLNGIINNQKEEYFSDFNEELWTGLSIDSSVNVKTDSFFRTLNEYIPLK